MWSETLTSKYEQFSFHTLNHVPQRCFIPFSCPAFIQASESNHITDLCFSCWPSLNMVYLQIIKYAGQPTTGIRLWPWPTHDELFSLSQVKVDWELSPAPSKTFISPQIHQLAPLLPFLSFSHSCHFAFLSVSFWSGHHIQQGQKWNLLREQANCELWVPASASLSAKRQEGRRGITIC